MQPARRLSNRAFGLMFCAVFAVVSGVAWFVFDARVMWTIYASAGFFTAALAAPWILLPLNRLWGLFALRLGAFNNKLLLGLFFFLVVTPMGAAMRLFGRDSMHRARAPGASYFTPVGRKSDSSTLPDMF
ncbi:MAG: SxtJ family membrane protein [Rhodospirillales bacterium]